MVIPSTLLRTMSVYRSWGEPGQRLGCGFWVTSVPYQEIGNCTDYWALGLVLRGHGRFGGEPIEPGCAHVRHPGVRHDFQVSADYAECWLDLGGPLASMPAQIGLTTPERPIFRAGLDLSLIRRWDGILTQIQQAPEVRLPVLAGALLGLAAHVVDASQVAGHDEHADLLSEACQVLEGGAGAPALARLAKKHGLSFERLRKVFRARIGVAPGAYRMRLRMDRAQALLRDGSLTVAEVAAAVGCASTATFSLQFKAHTGMPPDAWRRGQNR